MTAFLLVLSTVFIVLGVAALWNGSLIAEVGFDLAWRLGGAVCTLLGVFSGYSGLRPRINFGPVTSEFDDCPLELFFRIENAGLFVLTDVTCDIAQLHTGATISMDPSRPTVLYPHNAQGRLETTSVQTFSGIEPQRAQTLDIRKALPLLPKKPDEASISVDISFRQRFVPIRENQTYKYKLFRTAGAKYQWCEVSGELTESSNKSPARYR